jgi:hypothetical protein
MMRFFTAALLALAATIGCCSSADAAFRLRVEDTTGGDPGIGVVLTATSGSPDVISFNGAIGGFSVVFTVGTKTPTYQAPGYYSAMDLNNISIQSAGAGSLRIILEYDGFNTGSDGEQLEVTNQTGGSFSGPSGSSVTFTSYANRNAGQPDLGSPDVTTPGALSAIPISGSGSIGDSPAVSTSQTFGTGAFSGTSTTSFVKNGTYSLYSVVTVNFTGKGSISFDNTTETSPAPAGLVLALTAAPFGIGAWLRRRRAIAVVA